LSTSITISAGSLTLTAELNDSATARRMAEALAAVKADTKITVAAKQD